MIEPGAGGGADEREAGQVEPDRPGGRALAEDDVDLEVLHRRVEHLLHHAREAVDLVDEEHVALAELGEHRGEVAGPLDGRARRDVHGDAHLGGDDPGQARLAQARAGRRSSTWSTAWPRRRAASRMIARCSLSSRWPTNSSSVRGRRLDVDRPLGVVVALVRAQQLLPHRASPPRHGEALEGVAQEEAGVAVVGQVGHDLADLGVGVAEAGEGLAHVGPRRRPGRRRAAGVRRDRASPRSGTDRRDLRSISSRAAVFLPTPGTRHSAPRSSSATIRARATGAWIDRIPRASAGPTPWAPSSASKQRRSSLVAKP